jgi:hypothetical protein
MVFYRKLGFLELQMALEIDSLPFQELGLRE